MKINTLTTREVYNPETGEYDVIENSKTIKTKVSEDNFYMVFTKFIGIVYDIKPDKAKDLLIWLCNHAEFNTGRVSLTTAQRQKIVQEVGISNNSITNYLKVLKDAKVISGEKGEFIINPQIFWKGELNARRKIMEEKELQITFGFAE